MFADEITLETAQRMLAFFQKCPTGQYDEEVQALIKFFLAYKYAVDLD